MHATNRIPTISKRNCSIADGWKRKNHPKNRISKHKRKSEFSRSVNLCAYERTEIGWRWATNKKNPTTNSLETKIIKKKYWNCNGKQRKEEKTPTFLFLCICVIDSMNNSQTHYSTIDSFLIDKIFFFFVCYQYQW